MKMNERVGEYELGCWGVGVILQKRDPLTSYIMLIWYKYILLTCLPFRNYLRLVCKWDSFDPGKQVNFILISVFLYREKVNFQDNIWDFFIVVKLI